MHNTTNDTHYLTLADKKQFDFHYFVYVPPTEQTLKKANEHKNIRKKKQIYINASQEFDQQTHN